MGSNRPMPAFTRRELQELRDRASRATMAGDVDTIEWKCLGELAHAADQLDALYARECLDEAVAAVEQFDVDLDEVDPFDVN